MTCETRRTPPIVTGLTDDSFGSLSPDLLRQFVTEFKMPEQFAKIGDRIVAIPMISEEQQKQTVLEEKSSIVNENTSGMAVDGHIGTWHTIDHKEIDGHTFWLMEHDTFGDDASCIIVSIPASRVFVLKSSRVPSTHPSGQIERKICRD